MDLRDPLVPTARRPFGRRAEDAALRTRLYAAAFVAQVAGLSMPKDRGARAYDIAEPVAPLGLVRDEKV